MPKSILTSPERIQPHPTLLTHTKGLGVATPPWRLAVSSAMSSRSDGSERSRPKIIGAEAKRTQSARPDARERATRGPREHALDAWVLGAHKAGSSLYVRTFLQKVVAELRDGSWSCVEVYVLGAGHLDGPRSGGDAKRFEHLTPAIWAQALSGSVAAPFGEAVFEVVRKVLAREPATQYWLVVAERDAANRVQSVRIFADARRPALSLATPHAKIGDATGVFASDNIVCTLEDGDTLWRMPGALGQQAWDDLQAGVYSANTGASAQTLRASWTRRAAGVVPRHLDVDTQLWTHMLNAGRQVLPAALDDVMHATSASIADANFGLADDSLVVLANALVSAEAQRCALGDCMQPIIAHVRKRLCQVVDETTLVGADVALGCLTKTQTTQSLLVWAYAWALSDGLEQSHVSKAPSIQTASAPFADLQQLRLGLGHGRYLTPNFVPAAFNGLLPAPQGPTRGAAQVVAPWQSHAACLHLCANMLGDSRVMALWSGAEPPGVARMSLAQKRFDALALKVPQAMRWQLQLVAGALCAGLGKGQDVCTLGLQELVPPASVQALVALWSAQLLTGIAETAPVETPEQMQRRFAYLQLALEGLMWLGQAHVLPFGRICALLAARAPDAKTPRKRYAALVACVIRAAHSANMSRATCALLVGQPLHHAVQDALEVYLPQDDAYVNDAITAHIEGLCAKGAWDAALDWLCGRGAILRDLPDAVRLHLLLETIKKGAKHTELAVQLARSVQHSGSCLALFCQDKAAWRLLCRTAFLVAPLGTMLLREPSPPQALWNIWQGAAEKNLSAAEMRELCVAAHQDHVLTWRLWRYRCAHATSATEAWQALASYQTLNTAQTMDVARNHAALVEALCLRVADLGGINARDAAADAQPILDAMRQTWSQYLPLVRRESVLKLRLQLAEMRQNLGDIDDILVDLAAVGPSILTHPLLIGPWADALTRSLVAAANRDIKPPQRVLAALGGVAHLAYPMGPMTATHAVDMGCHLLFALIQWEQSRLAGEVLDQLYMHLGEASFLAMLQACTIANPAHNAQTAPRLPVHPSGCLTWLDALERAIELSQSPAAYVVLVEGWASISFAYLAESVRASRAALGEKDAAPQSAIALCDGDFEASARSILWVRALRSVVALEALCPISAAGELQKNLSKALAAMDAHSDVRELIFAMSAQQDMLRTTPLWRSWVFCAEDLLIRRGRAIEALQHCGIDVDVDFTEQYARIEDCAKRDMALGLLLDFASVLVASEASEKVRLARFDAIARVMFAESGTLHRWWDLVESCAEIWDAPIARRRLAILANLYVQSHLEDADIPTPVYFAALNLTYYLEHAIAIEWPQQAQRMTESLCSFAGRQTLYRRQDWLALCRRLNRVLTPLGAKLGGPFHVLEIICQASEVMGDDSLRVRYLGPSDPSRGVASSLVHPSGVMADTGLHYFLVGHTQLGLMPALAQSRLRAALVQALRVEDVRRTAFGEMLHWPWASVDVGLVRDIFDAMRMACAWTQTDIAALCSVVLQAANKGFDETVLTQLVASLAQSVGKSALWGRDEALVRAEVVLRGRAPLKPLADALRVMMQPTS